MEKVAKRLAAVAIVVAVVVVGGGSEERRASAATSIVPDHAGFQFAEPAEKGRWTVDVSLSRSRLAPLQLSTGSVRRAPSSSSHPWIQHSVKITNLNDERKVHHGDTRKSKYLDGPAERALLGADEGCNPSRSGTYADRKVKFRVAHRPERARSLTITYDIARTP